MKFIVITKSRFNRSLFHHPFSGGDESHVVFNFKDGEDYEKELNERLKSISQANEIIAVFRGEEISLDRNVTVKEGLNEMITGDVEHE